MFKGIAVLRKYKKLIPPEFKCYVHYSYVESHLEFISLYLSLASTTTRNRIIKLQKQAIRLVAGTKANAHTAKLFRNLNITPIEVLHQMNVFEFIVSLKKTNCIETLSSCWNFTDELGNRTSGRHSHLLSIPRIKYKVLEKYPMYDYSKVYSHIISFPNINNDTSIADIKSLLFDKYFKDNECKSNSCYICKKKCQ